LWTALADFHIRRGAFEVARDVYEEGLAAVATVRDFGLIFDALRWGYTATGWGPGKALRWGGRVKCVKLRLW